MRKRLLLIIVVSMSWLRLEAQVLTATKKQYSGVGYVEYLPLSYDSFPDKKYPALIFLHGKGERGDGGSTDLNKIINGPGVPELIKNGHDMCFDVNGKTECFVVIAPQSPSTNTTWKTANVAKIVDHVMDTSAFRIDLDRIYLTGLSLGGEGVWKYAYNSHNVPNKIAAIAVVAGKPSVGQACTINDRGIDVLAYHSLLDSVYSHNTTKNMFAGMANCTTPPPSQNLRFISYDTLNHNRSIDRAYLSITYSLNNVDTTESINYNAPLNLYEWLLHQSKDTVTSNQPPIVDAGLDVTVTLPIDSVLLTSSASDSDGAVVSYSWVQVSGPSTATLSGANTFELLASDLTVGVYEFEVSVTDDDSASSSDMVQVTVEDSITPGASWLQIARELGTSGGRQIKIYYDSTKSNNLTVRNSGNDTLVFYVKNISSGLDWGSMDISLRVNGQTRTRVVGDYVIDSVTANWTKVVIPLDDFGHDPSRWDVGLSELVLKVRNGFGYGDIGIDEIKFTGGTSEFVWYGDDYEASGAANAVTQTGDFYIVDRPSSGGVSFLSNLLPIVDAGLDVTVTLPTDSVLLTSSASDSDGTVVSYSWVQVSGPSTATLSGANTFKLLASDLIVGIYEFEISVTDDDSASSSDVVQVTVEDSITLTASWLQVTRESGTIGGRQIKIYYDSTKSNNLTVRNSGNDTLVFYVKNITSGLDWGSMDISLRVNGQTRTRVVGDYVIDSVTANWTKVVIPLDSFGHDPNRWDVGLSELVFKVRNGFGYGDMGIDEIKFTGGTSEFVWYGDDYEASGATNAVTQTSDFYIADRPSSGGFVESIPFGRISSSDRIEIELNNELGPENFERTILIHPGDRVVIYSPRGQILYDKKFQTEISLKILISTEPNHFNGLTIFNISRVNGDQLQIKYFISK